MESWRDQENLDKNPNALTYGISPSAPASLNPVEIEKWKANVSPTCKHYFYEKYEELVRQYQSLVDEFNINRMIYESSIGFEPIIGHIYFLYEKPDGTRFLSLIDPQYTFWPGFLGKFRLNAQFTWEKVEDSCETESK